jgi:NAD(P)-dependent dehydrogenase (short-subunit alcohol dehydrogenase family)
VAVPVEAAVPAAAVAPVDLIHGDDGAAAAVVRRIPTAVLRPALDLCAPTGVELGEGTRVVVFLDEGGVGSALVSRLEKLGVVTLAVTGRPSADELAARIDEFRAAGPVTGVYWLSALDHEPAVADLDLAGWREALRVRVKLLYATMRHLYEDVGGAGTFLVAATRLGGRHGYDEAGAVAPMGGGVAGFTKAYKRERPEALVKVVDFEATRKTAALADLMLAETLRDPGVVEVGHTDDHRWTVSLTEETLPLEGRTLGPDSVFVVTGAAGSIVSAITADLAAASRGVFHLLDLTPEPDPADPDIIAFATDREGLKRTIFDRLKASGERATPALVDKELARIERSHAALNAVRAVEAAGGTVRYHHVNLLDGPAVEAAMAAVAATSGKVDVLLHAGGLEISRRLPDKQPAEFDLVFDVKADGWFNLLHGLGDTPIGSTVVFSSVAGRFGNNGQPDYAAANDLLCKFTSSFKTTRPDTLGVAIDWTAWGDIGMATRGSIPTVMKAVGIDMLPAAAGIPIVRREVTLRATSGEVVIGGRLGILLEEFHPTGGIGEWPAAAAGVLFARPDSFGIYQGLTVSATLDPATQPFLFDHQIDGVPVLPGVMGVEAFAEAARVAFPDLAVAAVEDVEFLAPFKFYRHEPRAVKVMALFTVEGGDVLAHCRLTGERRLANQEEPQTTVHFTGRVRLAAKPPSLPKTKLPARSEPAVAAGDIYRIYFHGPAYQVLEESWRTGDGAAGVMPAELPPNHVPEEAPTVTAPRLAELCFQAAGMWEIGTTGRMALPMHIDRVTYVPGVPMGRATAVVTPVDGAFDVRVADEKGATLVEMVGYRTIPMPSPVADDLVEPLRRVMRAES